MESCYIVFRDLRQRLDFKFVGKCLFDSHFVLATELHQKDVGNVQNDQNEGFPELYSVSIQEDRDHDQINKDENRFTRDNPPIDKCFGRHNQVKNAYIKINAS